MMVIMIVSPILMVVGVFNQDIPIYLTLAKVFGGISIVFLVTLIVSMMIEGFRNRR